MPFLNTDFTKQSLNIVYQKLIMPMYSICNIYSVCNIFLKDN